MQPESILITYVELHVMIFDSIVGAHRVKWSLADSSIQWSFMMGLCFPWHCANPYPIASGSGQMPDQQLQKEFPLG